MDNANKSKFFYGWVVVAACFLLCFSWGFFYSYGAFFKELTAEFGWSRAATSTVVSVNTIFYVIGSIIIGWLSDRYKLRWLVLGAAILYGAGLALCSQIPALWQLYILFGVMGGFALGSAYTPPTATVQRWFVKRRGLTLGIALAGIGIGTFIMTPVAARFISTYGWRTSYIFMGIIVFLVLAIAAFFIVRHPEDKGLKPYGAITESVSESSAPSSAERNWTAREALRTKPFWMAWLMWLFFSIPILLVMTHIIPHAEDIGISKVAAAGALGLIGGVSIIGRLMGGVLADRIGFNRVVGFGCLLCGVMVAFLIGVKSVWMLYLFVVIYGLGYGAKAAMGGGLIGHLFGTKSLPTILGFVITSWAVAGIIAPPVAGYIFDKTGSYNIAFIIGAVSFAIAGTLALTVKPPQKIFSIEGEQNRKAEGI